MAEYKNIPGFEGIYEAGDDGSIWTCEGKITYRRLSNGTMQKRVWQRRRLKPKIQRRVRSASSDERVELWINSSHKTYLVSRLVALAFISNPDGLPCINHLDGNPLNNVVTNLEWCSYERNVKHAYLTGLNQEPTEIILLNTISKETKYFTSMSAASHFLEKNSGFISASLKQGVADVNEYRIFVNARMEEKYV